MLRCIDLKSIPYLNMRALFTFLVFLIVFCVCFVAAGITSPSSLYQRSLKPTGSLISAPPHPSQAKDIACTKCSRVNHSVPELHRHMLDCGGDTTWHLTMVLSSPVNGRRNRKWRPFGSRRRRQQGRRGLKRNIPNTPQRPKTNQPKTRGGDGKIFRSTF